MYWIKNKIKLATLCIACIVAQQLGAQTDSTEIENMDEIIISAKKTPLKRGDITRQIEVLSNKQIADLQPATLADAIQLSGKAFIQKSQLGGGSITMRGFEASRILLVIDGVRVNNATYRSGHLQDIITFDQFALQNTEFLFGGGSSMYGSDALGGVVYLQTKHLNFSSKPTLSSSGTLRFSSAGNNATTNAALVVTNQKSAYFVNATYNHYGDLKMGKGAFGGIDSFGYRKVYAARINNKDTALVNNKPRTQIGSTYNQVDLMFKGKFKAKKFEHGFNINTSLSSEIPRYDRLRIINNNGLPNHATWYYTPQNRSMALYFIEKNTATHGFKATAAVQNTRVGRGTRKFNKTSTDLTTDIVNMYTLNLDAYRNLKPNVKSYVGAELVYNNVNSKGVSTNINTLAITPSEARYTDSTTYTFSQSLYAGLKGVTLKNKLRYDAAVRLTNYNLFATYASTFASNFQYKTFDFNNLAPSVDVGLVYNITHSFAIVASAQSAFRNPNVDDVSKLFETASGIKLVVPNNDLKEERTVTTEVGLRYSIKKLNIETGVYNTIASNLMVDQARGDSQLFQSALTPVFQTVNAASAQIQGMYLNFQTQLAAQWFAYGNISLTSGTYKLNATSATQPLDHIPPTFGKWGIKYKKNAFQAQFFSIFNGIKVKSEYSPSGEDNQANAPNGFTPAWRTYHIAFNYAINHKFSTWLNIDNLANKNYRPFASGINAAGRNISITLKYQL